MWCPLARLQICLHYLDSGGFEAKRHQIRGSRGADDIFGYIRVGRDRDLKIVGGDLLRFAKIVADIIGCPGFHSPDEKQNVV